jgi:hypothetical protein
MSRIRHTIETVGDLKLAITDLPDDIPVMAWTSADDQDADDAYWLDVHYLEKPEPGYFNVVAIGRFDDEEDDHA